MNISVNVIDFTYINNSYGLGKYFLLFRLSEVSAGLL